VVLQSLFEWDFRGFAENGVGPAGSASGTTVAAVEDAKSIIARNAKEFAPGVGDISFIEELMANILAKRTELDLVIEKAAPDWPIDKISIVDRNILRIGLYELIFADRKEVPAKVAINESIELAKTFGGENSSKFVNGVLGSVYKELGEPGKDDIAPKKRAKIEDVPYEKMPIQNLGGAVVFSRDGDAIYLAFVHDIFGHWTLSKGKIAEGIPVREGTVAKVKEEMVLTSSSPKTSAVMNTLPVIRKKARFASRCITIWPNRLSLTSSLPTNPVSTMPNGSSSPTFLSSIFIMIFCRL
jgi:N utilization substance protein B